MCRVLTPHTLSKYYNLSPQETHAVRSTSSGKGVRSADGTNSERRSKCSTTAGNCLNAASPVPSMPGAHEVCQIMAQDGRSSLRCFPDTSVLEPAGSGGEGVGDVWGLDGSAPGR